MIGVSDSYPDRLQERCSSKIRPKEGYDLLRQLFAYDPDNRLTAREAMEHKWSQDDPKPTRKYASPHPSLYLFIPSDFNYICTVSLLLSGLLNCLANDGSHTTKLLPPCSMLTQQQQHRQLYKQLPLDQAVVRRLSRV